MVVVAPVAIMAGKKAADNPAASLFMVILIGAVLVQGLKKLPGFGIDLLGNIPGVAPVKAAYVASRDAVVDVWETEGDLLEGFETITQDQDPLGKQFFGDFSGYLGPDDEEEFGFWQTGYRGARTGLFTGLRSPWAPW